MREILPFWLFCGKVLGLNLTPGQCVIAKIAFGNYDPADLEGEEREIALEMFGGLERVPASARRYIVLRLGRGSGKTTVCSAYSVYTALTHDISRCGPGDVPYVITIAPDKPTAQLSIRMAREMIRTNASLERLVVSDTEQSIAIRRPDGRMVRIEAFAATRGGSAIRGRTIMAFLMDEAEFFTSNSEGGGGGREYAVNDREIFRALKPRLLKNGKGMLVSTPWPAETLMGELFDHNWGKPQTAVAVKATTLQVRGNDPDIVAMVEDELKKDPENARRELFCEVDGLFGGEFFDVNALAASLSEGLSSGSDDVGEALAASANDLSRKSNGVSLPVKSEVGGSSVRDGVRIEIPQNISKRTFSGYNPRWPVAVGVDLGFTRDSSALVVVQFDGKYYRTVYIEEMRPKPGQPLKPSKVIEKFAILTKQFGSSSVIADGYYREALKESLENHSLLIIDAPEGAKGKAEVFQRTRSVLHDGLIRIPDDNLGRRLIQQAKLVTSKPSPGGTTTIKVPRKIGLGHGDIVSAWSLAVHHLAYAILTQNRPVYEPGTPEWNAEFMRRVLTYDDKVQRDYVKNLEKDVRRGVSKRRLYQLGIK